MKSSHPPVLSTNASLGNASLEKGLTLFNRIVADGGATPLADLAADLALPRSTLYRLAGTLARAGLITRLARGCYDIGLPLAEKLHGASGSSHLARLCRPALRGLAQACNATAHLGVMENDMVTYLVKEGPARLGAAAFTRENAQLEAYCSGIGKVLLAWLPAPERERYLAGGPFVALTSQTVTDPAALRAHLQIVRAAAYARDDGEVAENLYCLAVPLWTQPEPVTAAISLSFARSFARKIDRHVADARTLASLRACAAKLRVQLGKS